MAFGLGVRDGPLKCKFFWAYNVREERINLLMRVLHLPTSVGGMAWGLAQGERSLGLESEVLYTNSSWTDYPANINLRLEEVQSKLAKLGKLFRTFLAIRGNYDIFHFNFGQSLINFQRFEICNAEVPFYPKEKKLFVTYNGCDARQKYPTIERTLLSACQSSDCYDGMCNSGRMDSTKRRSIAKMARYVRHMWAVNPDLLYFLPQEKSSFLPYSVNLDNISLARPSFENRKLMIVHAPTNRAVKGSDVILTALEKVQEAHGSKIEFKIVENLPQDQAIRIFEQADIFIDQILIGWYGGVAVEVMSMGKPVLCRIAEEDLHFIPGKMAADVKDAFINVSPSDISEVLLRCIEDREFLKRKSEAALEYAQTWHNPLYVAGITKEAYESY
jgi:glycosyltransferase involved in cell wall biosynthesis